MILLFTLPYSTARADESPAAGGAVSQLTVESMEGLSISLLPPAGKFMLIHFWTNQELESDIPVKDAISIYQRFHEKGLESVCVWNGVLTDLLLSFSGSWQIPWPQIDNQNFVWVRPVELWGVDEFPYNLLLNDKGRILATNLKGNEANETIAKFLSVSLDDIPMPEPAKKKPKQAIPAQTLVGGYGMVFSGTINRFVGVNPFERRLGVLQERFEAEGCKMNLRQISMALTEYRTDHQGELPQWLSDLYPTYLQDQSLLLCPTNASADHGYSDMVDPKLRTGYLYEFAPQSRAWKTQQLSEYGDQVPVVRCYSHGRHLNLSYGGEIYFTGQMWENECPVGRTLDDPDAIVRKQLREIAVALAKYKKDHNELPSQLIDLCTDYVKDESLFICPNTKEPLVYRFVSKKEVKQNEYGNYTPVIRVQPVLAGGDVINLAYSGEIYSSEENWEQLFNPQIFNLQTSEDTIPIATFKSSPLEQEKSQPVIAAATSIVSTSSGKTIIQIKEKEQVLALEGHWNMQNGKLTANDDPNFPNSVTHKKICFTPDVKTGEISFRIKVEWGWDGTGLVFGFHSPQDSYFKLSLGAMSNNAMFVDKFECLDPMGTNRARLTELEPFEWKYGEWYHVRMAINSSNRKMECYINDEKIISFETDEKFSGKFGIFSGASKMKLEDIQIVIEE
ncbi:MAG: hypothetical protein C4527_28885 [Candidatus Omnitrophota bacterium]|jgi:hypothetical protein|nr:MAG: hypothetical protein C4527_28885 [Candidatus Omnitrophota bacterium]